MFILPVILLSQLSTVAGQTFNLRVDPYLQMHGDGAWSVEVNADGAYVIIASAPFQDTALYFGSVVTSIRIDPDGNVLEVDRVVQSLSAYPGWSNSAAQLDQGGFVVGGNTRILDSLGILLRRPALFLFTDQGGYQSTIEFNVFADDGIGRQAKQTPDGGFVICGEASIGNQTDGFVIKTDPVGEQEWVRTYGGNWNDYILSIDLRSDGGYYTGGQQRITPANMDYCVYALNDTGEVVWETIWGSIYTEANAHLTTAADDHALIASGYGQNSNDHLRHYLAKLNATDGEIIWQRQYGTSSVSSALYVVQEITPGGDLIAAGGHRASSQTYGAMLRTTNTGDSLWMRYYQYSDSIVSDKQGLFRDVQPTPDGGFIACGTALAVPGIYSQDVWVVKVDQHGCLEPGCHLITGMETQITNMRDVLRVWPNPVQAQGQVQVELQLPDHFKPQGLLKLAITSSDGRLVQEQAIPPLLARGAGGEGQSFTFSPSHLCSGLYHLHLSDAKRWISGAKLVVE